MTEMLSNKHVLRSIREYALIVVGVFIFAFGLIGIILPAEIVGGGISGLAVLIFYATGGALEGGFPVSYSVFAINSVLLMVAFMTIGWKFSTKTIMAIILMPFAIALMQSALPPDVLGLEGDRLLSSILGGCTTGLGVAICVMQGGSTGGTDIIAMIINKYRNISFGKVMMACEFMIVASSYFIGNDVSMIVYSFVSVMVSAYIVDTLLAGTKQSSQIFVISDNYIDIADRVTKELGRGVTLLDAKGWYTKDKRNVMLIVCRKYETNNVLRIIRDCDNSAFITVSSVMGVFGQGFDNIKINKKTSSTTQK